MSDRLNPGSYKIELVVTYLEDNPYTTDAPIESLIYKGTEFVDGIAVESTLDLMKHDAQSNVLDDMTAETQADAEDMIDDRVKAYYHHEKYGDAL